MHTSRVSSLFKYHKQRTTLRFKHKVAVGLSGGVDSSVAALLLKKRGYDVIGVHMTNWDHEEEFGFVSGFNLTGGHSCEGQDALKMAILTSKKLDIPLRRVNFVEKYWNEVFQPFVRGYETGTLTPNPDVMCNRFIKFQYFLQFALNELGADKIATGHFCSLNSENHLIRGKSKEKDQSYFLSMVEPSAFEKTLFPVGELTKEEVRELARNNDLPSSNRKSSTGLCFVGKRKSFQDFLLQYVDPKYCESGNIVHAESGKVLGRHNGIWTLTIGQRARISGLKCYHYVAEKDVEKNEVYVVDRKDHPKLLFNEVHANSMNWMLPNCSNLKIGDSVICLHRYQVKEEIGQILDIADSFVRVGFSNPLHAVAPGQVLSIYDEKDRCLGGGLISPRRVASLENVRI